MDWCKRGMPPVPVHQHHASLALCKACIQYFVRPVGLKVYPYCKVVVFAFVCNNTLAPYIYTHIYIYIYTNIYMFYSCYVSCQFCVSILLQKRCKSTADALGQHLSVAHAFFSTAVVAPLCGCCYCQRPPSLKLSVFTPVNLHLFNLYTHMHRLSRPYFCS